MTSIPPFRRSALALALLALPLATLAQTIPNSGQILQQVAPPPATPRAEPKLDVRPDQAAATDDSTPFVVSRLQIDGNTVLDTATLHALVADGEGQTQTLTGLNALAQRITDYYRAHGYLLARAIIPAQSLSEGAVRIQVVEARYDRIALDNRSRVDDGLLRATLAPLREGDVVQQSTLDRSLLLLGELPGISPQGTLSPGAASGTSMLGVALQDTPVVQGNLLLDNAGTRYTGRMRAGANLNLDNPLRHGDQLSLGVLSSGRGMRHGRLGYQYTLNGAGSRLGAAYSTLAYTLGGSLRALRAHGSAQVGSAWFAQPLLRQRNASVDARLQVERKRLRDRIDSTALRSDRQNQQFSLGVVGQVSDGWAGGGLTTSSLTASRGTLRFDPGAAAAMDAATARTAGRYTRWNANLSRLQYLGPATRLQLSLGGQYSNRNLDSSEQFLLGGPTSVRGYDVASAAGASGWLASVELRHDLDWSCAGRCEARVFVDQGSVRFNARPWTAGRNRSTLRSAGVGFHWTGIDQWQLQTQLAAPLADAPPGIGKRHTAQAWLQLAKGF